MVEAPRSKGPDPSATPGAVTVIPVDERLAASADVASVVDGTPGATLQQLGGLGDWSAVSIRGSTLRQVQVYIDGVPLNPDGSSVVNLAELPLGAFSRVEVWRGNAPPELGAAPMGGVINLVTDDRDTTSFSAAYGSYHTIRLNGSALATGVLFEQPTRTMLFAETFSTRGDYTYFADNGTLYNTRDDRLRERANNDKAQLSAHGSWRVGDEDLQVTASNALLARDEGLPGHINQRTFETRLTTLRNLATVQVDGRTGAARGRLRTWSQLRDETYEDPQGELDGVARSTWGRTGTLGLLVDGRYAASEAFVPALTFEARRESYVGGDALQDGKDPSRIRYAATGSGSADVRLLDDRLLLAPVVQVLWLDSRGFGTLYDGIVEQVEVEETVFAVNPRLGVLVHPVGPVALKGNVGRYTRPPDMTELFGDHGATVGNDDLVSERGWQWDLGARLVAPDNAVVAGSVDASYFWNASDHLITWLYNGQGLLRATNLGKAWVQGLEAAADAELFDVVQSRTSLTHTISVNLSSDPAYANNQLPRLPTWELEQSTSVHLRQLIRVGHGFSYTAGNYWDATNWYLSPPRPIHSAFVRVRPGRGAPSFAVDVLNLTDRIVEVVPRNPLDPEDDARIVQAMTDFSGYPLPGRTFLFTVRWTPEENAR